MGGGPQQWPSLNRTRSAYLRALELEHVVEHVESVSGKMAYDVLINFSGDLGWELLGSADRPPIAFALHGGAVLNLPFIVSRLPDFRPGDCFIGNCESDAAVIECVSPSAPPVHVLPLPAEIVEADEPVRREARHSLGILPEQGAIVIIARLVPQKNVHNALRIVAAAMRLGSKVDWRIMLVGNFWTEYPVLKVPEFDYHEWMKEEVARLGLERRLTIFPASLSENQMHAVYEAADLAMSMTHSIDENFGYFAVEAMSHGVPVLGTAYGGQKDSIKADVSGWPVPTWSTQAGVRSSYGHATSLLRSLSLEDVADTGSRARSFARNRFGEAVFQRKLNAICSAAWESSQAPFSEDSPSASDGRGVREKPDLHPRIRMSFEHDCLQDYALPVGRYVSSGCPLVVTGDKVSLFAPLIRRGEDYVAADPAWPVHYSPSTEGMKLIARLSKCDDYAASEHELEGLQCLMDDGILVPGHPTW